MSVNNNSYSVSNEQLLLIDILNSMYNDNLRQINNFTSNISNLNQTNTQIRNLLVQILNNQHRRNNNDRRNVRANAFRDNNTNNNNTNNNVLGRIFLNNTPYIIDSVSEYRIPLNRNEMQNTNYSRLLQNFFQPVEIYPTQTQIESATRRVRYGDIITPRNRSCPISLDNFEDNEMVTSIRFCGHVFRTDELNTWFRSNCNCPVCRYDIREYNSNASSEFFGATGPSESTSSSSTNSNQQNTTQNNSPGINVERNNNETNNRQPNLLSLMFNRFASDALGINRDNLNIDISGNIFNEIFNDTTSDPLALYNLINTLNERNQI